MPAFDVIVVGGGPAGSSAAGFLAQSGVRVALFEKELGDLDPTAQPERDHAWKSFTARTTLSRCHDKLDVRTDANVRTAG